MGDVAGDVEGEEVALVSKDIFSPYAPSQTVSEKAKHHPGDIVEAASLAAVRLPRLTYPILEVMDEDKIVGEGKLSDVQLEAVTACAQRHETVLADGNRAAFFLGDGAGVGKGRQIAAVIFNQLARGSARHIWFSTSTDLYHDAKRDLEDLGCHVDVINGCQEVDRDNKALGMSKDGKGAVLFSTYATLISSRGGGSRSANKVTRFDQMVAWAGGADFDGCLVFDESHKAKNFVPDNDKASTKIATSVCAIQAAFPMARVMYCSATGVTEIKNMAFMNRLGLWGTSTAFADFADFAKTISSRGIGAHEMLAMQLKAQGVYVSRGLAFSGCEFDIVQVPLAPAQRVVYDTAARLWVDLHGELLDAFRRTGGTAPRGFGRAFWGGHQRFFRQLCVALKVPALVDAARAALDDGHCVVIGLQSTGEFALAQNAAASATVSVAGRQPAGKITDFVSNMRVMLLSMIDQYYATDVPEGTQAGVADDVVQLAQAYPGQIFTMPDGRRVLVPETVTPGMPAAIRVPRQLSAGQTIPELVQKRDAMKLRVLDLNLPNTPLDELIDRLGGPSAVAEMTGRTSRVVRQPSGRVTLESRAASLSADMERVNLVEKDAFMAGKKLVAIISDAASTGISLHADARVRNRRRRVHFTLELPWSAEKAIQQLGRSHRSNQTSGPIYRLMTSEVAGERRFASAVATRLESLGALTKGDRRAATGLSLAVYNIDTAWGRRALTEMVNASCRRELVSGLSLDDVRNACTLVANDPGTASMGLPEFFDRIVRNLVQMELATEKVGGMGSVNEDKAKNVKAFLNRLLGQPVADQDWLFAYFSVVLDDMIRTARREGKYSDGVADLTGTSVKLARPVAVLFADAALGIEVSHAVVHIDRGVSAEAAADALDSALRLHEESDEDADADGSSESDSSGETHMDEAAQREARRRKLEAEREARRRAQAQPGFFVSNATPPRVILAVPKEHAYGLWMITRPNVGLSAIEWDQGDLRARYRRVSRDEGLAAWRAEYTRSLTQCTHGDKCKHGSACHVGMRARDVHLLCGSIVAAWRVIEATMRRPDLSISKSERQMQVKRVTLDDGTRLIGMPLGEHIIIAIRQALEAGGTKAPPEVKAPLSDAARAQEEKTKNLADLLARSYGRAAPASELGAVQRQAAVDAAATAIDKARVVKDRPVDRALLARLTRPVKKMRDFFAPVSRRDGAEQALQRAAFGRAPKRERAPAAAPRAASPFKAARTSPQGRASPAAPVVVIDADDSTPVGEGTQTTPVEVIDLDEEDEGANGETARGLSAHEALLPGVAKAPLQCPICQVALPATTTNVDLNRHVDACVARMR